MVTNINKIFLGYKPCQLVIFNQLTQLIVWKDFIK
jgi:hypothetical protein